MIEKIYDQISADEQVKEQVVLSPAEEAKITADIEKEKQEIEIEKKKREKIILDNKLDEGQKVTENLIANTRNSIVKEYRESIFQECLAKLFYAKKDYKKAQELLVSIEVKDILRILSCARSRHRNGNRKLEQ